MNVKTENIEVVKISSVLSQGFPGSQLKPTSYIYIGMG